MSYKDDLDLAFIENLPIPQTNENYMDDTCPVCDAPVYYTEGCVKCSICEWNKCSN